MKATFRLLAEVHTALAYASSHPDGMRTIETRNRSIYEEHSANRLVPDETRGCSMEPFPDENIETEWR